MNIAAALDHAALEAPELPAILFEDQTVSYGELEQAASQLAHALAAWQVEAGDRVAVCLPNIPAFVVACLGAQKLGAVVVSLSSMLKGPELAFALADSGAQVLFTTAALLPELAPVRADLRALAHVVVCDGPAGASDVVELTRLLSAQPARFSAAVLPPEAPAAILYTSGTTGTPKGAVLTHGNLLANTENTLQCVGFKAADRHLLFLPLSHCFGQNFIMHSALSSLGCIVLQRRYQLATLVDDLERYAVTHFYGVPTNYIQLLESGITREQLACVRCFFSAAASLPREVAEAFRDRFRTPIYEGYGLTETSPLATYNHRVMYRTGSVGTAVAGVELKVVDADGRSCAPGERGEICIKGPNVMAGYYRRELETRAAIRDGWFHSGDIGYLDAEGYLYVVDRLKDMINCSGYKVWPREVEEVLYQHAAVAECAVVGAADAQKGERVVAYVRLRPEAALEPDALRAHCEARLARYKLPSEFRFDRVIPKSPSGKILKRLLRDAAADA